MNQPSSPASSVDPAAGSGIISAHHGVAPGSCRFRNCRERSEPGCAVLDLASAGQIPVDRYATYLEILDAVEAGEAQNRYRGKKG